MRDGCCNVGAADATAALSWLEIACAMLRRAADLMSAEDRGSSARMSSTLLPPGGCYVWLCYGGGGDVMAAVARRCEGGRGGGGGGVAVKALAVAVMDGGGGGDAGDVRCVAVIAPRQVSPTPTYSSRDDQH